MTPEQLLESVTPQTYEQLKMAVETGKWEDGSCLTEAQRAHAMQVTLLYQAKHCQSGEHLTIGGDGQIVMKSKQALRTQYRQDNEQPLEVKTISTSSRSS